MSGNLKENVIGSRSIEQKIFSVFLTIFMIVLSIIMIYPYLNVLAKAFNEGVDSMRGGITIFPRRPTFQNFLTLFQNDQIINSAMISIARALLGTFLALIVQFTAAYAIKKKNLKGKGIILLFLMFPMFFGGGLIPVYILYSRLQLLNNFLVYVLPGAFNLFNMVIIRTYLRTIPESFEESAKLDGANELVIMFRIIIPLSTPILATVTLWTIVGHWNDWVTSLYFITRSKLFTMQFVLMKILREYEQLQNLIRESIQHGRPIAAGSFQSSTSEAIQAAQIILTTIPIIVTYPFLQKYFVKGIMIGSLKE